MKLLAISIFSIIFFVALIFSVLNFHPIQINLYFTSFSLPLTVALLIELLAGIAIGFLVAVVHIIKLKAEYQQLSKKFGYSSKK
jgi:lipopolysaccharide assembly protein A